MRSLVGALLAASLVVTAVQAEPLAPGKPAGVRAARLSAWNTAVMLGTGGIILAGVGILVSGTSSVVNSEHFDSNAVPFQPNNNVTPTTGTTG